MLQSLNGFCPFDCLRSSWQALLQLYGFSDHSLPSSYNGVRLWGVSCVPCSRLLGNLAVRINLLFFSIMLFWPNPIGSPLHQSLRIAVLSYLSSDFPLLSSNEVSQISANISPGLTEHKITHCWGYSAVHLRQASSTLYLAHMCLKCYTSCCVIAPCTDH